MRVVFPAPVAPTMATFCPGRAAKEMSFISGRSGV